MSAVRVMVVDDTSHVRRMLRQMLELDGFEVHAEAGSGQEALETIEDVDPQVLVLDHMMPGMSGLQVAREVRARRPAQVIILYSAFLDEGVEREAAEAGVDLCLPKLEGLPSLEREIARFAGTPS